MFPMKTKGKTLSMADRCGSPLVLLHLLLTLFLMAFLSFLPTTTTTTTTTSPQHNRTNKKKKKKKKKEKESEKEEETCTNSTSSSWDQFKNLLSCKSRNSTSSQVHDPSSSSSSSSSSSKYVKLSSTCGASICSFRDHGNTRVVDHASNSSDGSNNAPQRSRRKANAAAAAKDSAPPARPSHARSGGGSGGMQLRKLSGCYECRAIDAEPASRRYPRPRTLCPCNDCGEVFTKPESLEHHQALRHAVSELGPDDSGRNIVEIIFKSSWQKKDSPVCRIERILKVHNTQRTAARFEDYRESVKSRALLPRKNPRCAADGNELLRFHCTSVSCPLGANSSTSLCHASSSSSSSTSGPNTNLLHCDVCTIIRHGFSRAPSASPQGIRTTASSGRADDCGLRDRAGDGARRAMLVCRVIAGRVRRGAEDQEGPGQFDSVAGEGAVGSYGNLEELFVANPRAILPCFVVIYSVMD